MQPATMLDRVYAEIWRNNSGGNTQAHHLVMAGALLRKGLLPRPTPPVAVADVIGSVRYTKISEGNHVSYEGASQQAMRGAEQGQRGGLAVRADD